MRRVFLPLMAPAAVTTGLLAFIVSWNEFLFALTFTLTNERRTVPPAIALMTGSTAYELPWGTIMAASVIVTAADHRAGPRVPAQDRGGPHGRRGEGLIREVMHG